MSEQLIKALHDRVITAEARVAELEAYPREYRIFQLEQHVLRLETALTHAFGHHCPSCTGHVGGAEDCAGVEVEGVVVEKQAGRLNVTVALPESVKTLQRRLVVAESILQTQSKIKWVDDATSYLGGHYQGPGEIVADADNESYLSSNSAPSGTSEVDEPAAGDGYTVVDTRPESERPEPVFGDLPPQGDVYVPSTNPVAGTLGVDVALAETSVTRTG